MDLDKSESVAPEAEGVESFFDARIRNQAGNIIYQVFGAQNIRYKPERLIVRQLSKLQDLITAALLTAHNSTRVPSDAKQDYVRGLKAAQELAESWANSPTCGEPHEDDPCCHRRTGAGIADAIGALITTSPIPSDAKLREQDLSLLDEIYDFFDQTGDGAEDASYSNRMANQFSGRLKNLIEMNRAAMNYQGATLESNASE